ncbi:hypothetical protein AN1V17_19850 [Vallitalea sediminicola]
MLDIDNQEKLLWGKCLKILNNVSNNNLDKLLENLIAFVIQNENILSKVADKEFLTFVKNVHANMFVVGSTKDDFERLTNNYCRLQSATTTDVWRIVSNLVWDLITMTTEEICPQCKSDNLRLLTDMDKNIIYKSCETCFWIEVNGKGIKRPNVLLPANKNMISKYELNLLK